MTGAIQIANLGTNTGPFNLYSNVNNFTAPFAVGITIAQLTAGYPTDKIPDAAKVIRIVYYWRLYRFFRYINIKSLVLLFYKTSPGV